MTFKLEPVDEGFLTSAPTRYCAAFAIARPAEEVWRELVSERPLHWCRGLSVHWTSERPFGVGTSRQAKVLGGAVALQERFFIWEEGRRYTFYATEANVPVFRRVLEDYVVEPDGPGKCRFTWTVALEPSSLGRLGGPVNRLIFKSLFADTRGYFNAG
jgi:Polyketide cyclase / dehydrase and lipid transport